MLKKPFFDHAVDDYVMEEICQCGHLYGDHGSLTVPLRRSGGHRFKLQNDGSCCSTGCTCKKFRWARFVYTHEYAEIVKAHRNPAVGNTG